MSAPDGRTIRPFFSIRSTVKALETIDLIYVMTVSRKKGGRLEQRHRFEPMNTATPAAVQRVLRRHTKKAIAWIEDTE
ncbi:MAG TPA: hypothetical protein PK416_03040 [Thermodesulfobacteriota bacterium]|nr:hypothetical protein [Thermodesulfobacteriota bacterium]